MYLKYIICINKTYNIISCSETNGTTKTLKEFFLSKLSSTIRCLNKYLTFHSIFFYLLLHLISQSNDEYI